MEAWNSMKLLREYSKCPECGNGTVGNGEGTVKIEENSFERTCKCGWKIKVDKEK